MKNKTKNKTKKESWMKTNQFTTKHFAMHYYLFFAIMIFAFTLATTFSFLDKPLYLNTRLFTTNTLLTIIFEILGLIAVGGLSYFLYKEKMLSIYTIVILASTAIIPFVNILGFIIVPVIIGMFFKLKQSNNLAIYLSAGFSVLLIPVAWLATFVGWGLATSLGKDEATSFLIQTGSKEQIGKKKSFTIGTWNIGYASTGSEADYFYDLNWEGKKGPWGKGQKREQTMQHLKGIEKFASSIVKGQAPNTTWKYRNTNDNNLTAIPNSSWMNKQIDFMLYQEVDRPSVRSFYTDQPELLAEKMPGYDMEFVNNIRSGQLPYPWFDPNGQVDGGVLTASKYHIDHKSAKRISLNSAGTGFDGIFNLKRALGYTEYKVDGGKTLHMFNLHMSAFPQDKEKRAKEFNTLLGLIKKYSSTNDYFIFGGDWNADISDQYYFVKHAKDNSKENSLSESQKGFDLRKQSGIDDLTNQQGATQPAKPADTKSINGKYNNSQLFTFDIAKMPNWLRENKDPKTRNNLGLKFGIDRNTKNPSLRMANPDWHGYEAKFKDDHKSDFAIIDGFLVSSNIQIDSVQTVQQDWNLSPFNSNTGFEDSDHNPVFMKFTLN